MQSYICERDYSLADVQSSWFLSTSCLAIITKNRMGTQQVRQCSPTFTLGQGGQVEIRIRGEVEVQVGTLLNAHAFLPELTTCLAISRGGQVKSSIAKVERRDEEVCSALCTVHW